MSGVNKVILVGHLGRDPEVRHLEGGASVANFTLATTENYVRDGTRMEQTEWHNIVVWRGLAEIAAKYLHKGKLIYLEGKIRTRSYDDKDGNKRYITEIVADNFIMLGRKDEQNNSSGYQNQPKEAQEKPLDYSSEPDDDLPF